MVNRASRAAQFLPFDSLKGFKEKILQIEEELSRIERKELSEEQQVELSEELMKLDKNSLVVATFYYNGHYVTIQDKVRDKNEAYRFIIVGETKIYFSDLYELKIIAR